MGLLMCSIFLLYLRLVNGWPLVTSYSATTGDSNLDASLANIELSAGSSNSGEPLHILTYDYAIIFDAGSSHTELFIYKWPTNKVNGTGIVVEDNKMACQLVLSDFKDNPKKAGQSLRECLNFAQLQVPPSKWNTTRVLLGATAGMRVLASNNEAIAREILHSVLKYIATNYQFIANPADIAILSPEKEGGLGWLAINFVKGILQQNALYGQSGTVRLPTWGSLDVGGASTQFSVEAVSSWVAPSFCARAFGQDYKIYTRSFLCYGKNEAYRRYKALLIRSHNFTEPIIDPCRPTQFTTVVQYQDHFARPCSNVTVADKHYKEKFTVSGGGDGERCHRQVLELFRQTMDLNPSYCPFQDGDCSFGRMKKGTVRGKFLGTGALYYDTRNLNILSNDSFTLNPFDAAGYRAARNAFCMKTHGQVEKLIASRPELKDFFIRHCFDATYQQVLLSNVYGLDDETLRDMVFAKDVNGVYIGWTMGWAIMVATDQACPADWKQKRSLRV